MPPKKSSLIRDYFIYDLQSNKSICQLEIELTKTKDTNDFESSHNESKVDCSTPSNWKKTSAPNMQAAFVNIMDITALCSESNYETEHPSEHKKPRLMETALVESEAVYKPKKKNLCLESLMGNKSSNLEKHVRSKHPRQYGDYLKRCGSSNKESDKSSTPGSTTKQLPLHSCFEKKNVLVSLNRSTVIDGIVKMICSGYWPLTILHEEGFLDIFDPIFESMGVRITLDNISDYIHTRYEMIQTRLVQLIYKKLISVKVDCVSWMGRSFLGINIQFLHNGSIVVFTLSAVELKETHTGENLKRYILEELEKYGVCPSQIYTITYDDGSNLKRAYNSQSEQEDGDGYESEINEDETFRIDDVFDDAFNESLSRDLIIGIRCAVHTLQLSVMDTLTNKHGNYILTGYLHAIDAARKVVKELRSPGMSLLVRSRGLRRAILDCPNRLDSIYDMLKSLRDKYKTFCEEFRGLNPKLAVEEETWYLIDEIILCLEPARMATLKLQAEELTLTDVYRILTVCQIETSKIGSAFSLDLYDNFVKRRESILETDPFYACMYLDPRFSFELCEEDKEKAIKHLVQVYDKHTALQKEKIFPDEYTPGNEGEEGSASASPSNGSENDDPAEIAYEKSMMERRKSLKINTLQSKASPDFEVICRSFADVDLPLRIRDSILQFWQKYKTLYPEISEVAQVVFGVPATQMTVERLISQLKFLPIALKYNLKAETINEILVIKCNFSKFQKL